MEDSLIKVLHISSWGRSGSTILGNILGEFDEFFFAGELFNIWDYFLMSNRLCACGEVASNCSQWQTILTGAYGNPTSIDPQLMVKFRNDNVRWQNIFRMLLPWTREKIQQQFEWYNSQLLLLYQAIQSNTNSRVIVDSSKRPAYAYFLGLNLQIDLYVVHLVRDPRAVAYSWLRKKIQQDLNGERLYMRRYNPIESAIRWDIRNLIIQLFWQRNRQRYILVRYEDMIAQPRKVIEQILSTIHEEPQRLPFVGENRVQLSVNHSVRGNPARFKTGPIELIVDSDWKSSMSKKDRRLVNVLTWPLLRRYGYCAS